jgi:enoyl-CoA hydratase/carnithine racemase
MHQSWRRAGQSGAIPAWPAPVPRAELEVATLRFARRLALIAPEALAASKLAINRGADAAGFRTTMQAGIDVVAPLYGRPPRRAPRFASGRKRTVFRRR